MQEIIEFLQDLKINNNREWFDKNRDRYHHVKRVFEMYIEHLIIEIKEFAPEIGQIRAADCTFRIFRDVRFSNDKTPYKTNLGAYVAPNGRKSKFAGYYLHLDPDASFAGGGIYMPQATELKLLRNAIYDSPHEFMKIIETPNFKQLFPEIHGEQLKKPPRFFPPEFEFIDLLKYKSYTVFHPINNQQFASHDFNSFIINIFETIKPFNDFLNKALSEE